MSSDLPRKKVAFVKSCYYQDLWICDKTSDQLTLLKTSLMRCPAIGLTEVCDAEFIIIKDFGDQSSDIDNNIHKINIFSKEKKYADLPFLDETYHADYSINEVSHDVDSIDWTKYDIVIAMNTVVPTRIIDTNPAILWCYYVGENNGDMNHIHSKYDVLLNQDVQLKYFPEFSVGIPYTYLGPRTLEDVYAKFDAAGAPRNGIYMEINNCTQRPVRDMPLEFQYIEYECAARNFPFKVLKHDQNIMQNTANLINSKYFVKILGRIIRGNSVIEAVSAGALVLANPNLILFADLVTEECVVSTDEDVVQKIAFFESNPEKYEECLKKQRAVLEEVYFRRPAEEIFALCDTKRTLREEAAAAAVAEIFSSATI